MLTLHSNRLGFHVTSVRKRQFQTTPSQVLRRRSRHSFVQLGVAGMASLGLGDVLRAKVASPSKSGKSGHFSFNLARWWPGHMDMYDVK